MSDLFSVWFVNQGGEVDPGDACEGMPVSDILDDRNLLLQPCMGGVSDHLPLSELIQESSDSLVNELLEEGGFLVFFDLIGTTGGSTLVNQAAGVVNPTCKESGSLLRSLRFLQLLVFLPLAQIPAWFVDVAAV